MRYVATYEFKKARVEKLDQANWICEDCGAKATDAHHIDLSKSNHAISNLKALCHTCHIGRYHSKKKGVYAYRPLYEPPDMKKCNRCGYEWLAKAIRPKSCPSCKSYEWNEPKPDHKED